MKFVTYNYNGTEYIGVLTNDETSVIPASEFGLKAGSMLELIKGRKLSCSTDAGKINSAFRCEA